MPSSYPLPGKCPQRTKRLAHAGRASVGGTRWWCCWGATREGWFLLRCPCSVGGAGFAGGKRDMSTCDCACRSGWGVLVSHLLADSGGSIPEGIEDTFAGRSAADGLILKQRCVRLLLQRCVQRANGYNEARSFLQLALAFQPYQHCSQAIPCASWGTCSS